MSTPASPSVAVIGGGISGLVTAVRLTQLGITNVTVFDTGKNGVGGRCSSRHVRINGRNHIFDHSCQYFTVSDPQFANIVSFLHKKGAIRQWDGPIGHIDRTKTFQKNSDTVQCFIGTGGMTSIPECLAELVEVRRPVWVGEVSWQSDMKKWKVDQYGFYDYLVIAHNGKCADRLMAAAGAPQVHSLLQARFSDHLLPKENKMTLCSLWVLLVAFPEPVRVSYQGAHVDGDQDISWIANNTAKLRTTDATKSGDQTECWTVLSTRGFGKFHKVPQEMVPPKKASEVTELLLTAFARVTKTKRDNLKPCFTKVQLWGAALPINRLNDPARCVFDAYRQVGVCGDWLVSPCIQGAALSGLALAERIHKHISGNTTTATNLKAGFQSVNGPPIGSFPTDPKMYFRPGQQT